MPQYLNPYEGVGNALINIGQNYDLDRRRKREAEEDQKRRRADYLWQSKKDEEAEARRYERMAPEREAKQKLDMLRAASQAAKAQRDLIESQMSKFINLPGAGGAIERKPQFDAEGNLVGYEDKKIPFTPYPTKPEGPSWISGVDANGNIVNIDRTTGRRVKTNPLIWTAVPIHFGVSAANVRIRMIIIRFSTLDNKEYVRKIGRGMIKISQSISMQRITVLLEGR
jgi:hypothetical protein